MKEIHYIESSHLNLSKLNEIISTDKEIALSEDAIDKIIKCRTFLDNKLSKSKDSIYGINTGFGALHNVIISPENLTILQENLVMSHACGIGEKVPTEIVKLMLFLKIQSLSYGHSGIQLDTVNRLIEFYNNDILPVIYTQGSLGASGDLAPLAHLALPLIGKGEVIFEGMHYSGQEILEKFKWKKITLQSNASSVTTTRRRKAMSICAAN